MTDDEPSIDTSDLTESSDSEANPVVPTGNLPPEDELPEGPDGKTLEYDGVRVPMNGELYLKNTRGNYYVHEMDRERPGAADPRVILKPVELAESEDSEALSRVEDSGHDRGESSEIPDSEESGKPDTETFRIDCGNGQVLEITGPVRKIEPGEYYHAICYHESIGSPIYSNCPTIEGAGLDGKVEAPEDVNREYDIIRIPASEATLRIKEDEDDA